jgi:phosphoribosylformylglycinamidine cyclo-ligase
MYDVTKPYKDAIVDMIEATWETPYLSAKRMGGYCVFQKKFDYPEIDHTDGIGTKGVQHWRFKTLDSAVADAFAMNINDLATIGAKPYKIQNHIILPEDDHEAIKEIIGAMSILCKQWNIAVTGGETSIHNNIVGMDISMTMSGFIEKPRTNRFRPGDCLIGLPSNGLHSNGFSMAMKYLSASNSLTLPTRIYHDKIMELMNKHEISNAIHIAGGGLTRMRQKDVDVIISQFKVPSVFTNIYNLCGIDEMMYKTFNCGVGFVISTDKCTAKEILKDTHFIDLGVVVDGRGRVEVDSSFSKKKINIC